MVAGLERLARAGFQLACITNKAEAFTLPLLRQLDLHKYFKLVLSGDSLPKQKPDPLPLTHACKHFGITPITVCWWGTPAMTSRRRAPPACLSFA